MKLHAIRGLQLIKPLDYYIIDIYVETKVVAALFFRVDVSSSVDSTEHTRHVSITVADSFGAFVEFV